MRALTVIARRYVKLNSRFVLPRLVSYPEQGQTGHGDHLHIVSEYGTRGFDRYRKRSDSFAAMPDVITRVQCPHCGERHNWSKYNAFLREVVRPERNSEPDATVNRTLRKTLQLLLQLIVHRAK